MTDVFSDLAGSTNALGDWVSALPAAIEEWLGALAPVVAGAATALAVAIAMAVYFRSGYRSPRDIVRHGFATIIVIGLLAFAAHDMRHAAFDFLGINPSRPAVEFEIRLPKISEFVSLPRETRVGLHIASRSEPLRDTTSDGSAIRDRLM